MTYSIWRNNLNKSYVTRGRHIRFLLAFFLCVFAILTSQAQTDTSIQISVDSVSLKKTPVQANTVFYRRFSSEQLFATALKKKSFTTPYCIVSITDTLGGVSRKRSGVVFANKLIIPFQYDSITAAAKDEFICTEYLAGRRFFSRNVVIHNARTKKIVSIRASAIQYISGSLYVVHVRGKKMLYNSTAQKFSAQLDTYTFIDTLFILTSVAEEHKLLHTDCSSFISSPFKELIHSNDSVYNAVLFNEWDIYKNTGEKIFSKLNCDSLQIAAGHGWNIYRNDSMFFRNYSSFYYENIVKPFVPVGTNHCAAVIDKFDYDTMKMRINFDTIFHQSDYLYLYRKVGKYGYCDTIGNVKIAHQYDTITDWHDNMAAIRMKNKWGYVTKREQMTVQPYYTKALPFANGAAAVYDGKKWMFINKDGKNINSVSYDSIKQTVSGKWYVHNKGLTGLCDIDGREIIPPMYQYLLDTQADVLVYKTEGLYGLIAKDRTIICKPVYDQFIYDSTNNCLLLKHIIQTPLLFVMPKQ